MKKFKGSVFIVFILMTGILSAQAAHKLEYKLKKGETYRYLVSGVTDMTQTVMGQEMKVKSDSKIIARYFVEDVTKEGNMVIVASLDSCTIKTSMPMKDTTMCLTEFLGKKVHIVFDKTGHVVEKKAIDTTAGVQVVTMLQAAQFFILPLESVSDKWNSVNTDSLDMMGGKIYNKSDINFTIQGKETKAGKNCLKIPLTGKINTNGKTSMMGMELFIEGTGKINGSFDFNEKEGLMTYTEANTELAMTMATTGENNMIIPITQSVKSVITLLDK